MGIWYLLLAVRISRGWGDGGVPKTAVGILIMAKRLEAATWHRLIPDH